MDNPKMVYVEMTKEHFLKGEPCSKFECAFALALDEKLKDGYAAGVTKHVIYYHERGDSCKIGKNGKFAIMGRLVASTATPRSVRRFIKKYDDKKPEDTFELPLRTRIKIPGEILA